MAGIKGLFCGARYCTHNSEGMCDREIVTLENIDPETWVCSDFKDEEDDTDG